MKYLTVVNFKKALSLIFMIIGILSTLIMAWSPLVFMIYAVYAVMTYTYESFGSYLVDVILYTGTMFFSAMACLLFSKFVVGMLDLNK